MPRPKYTKKDLNHAEIVAQCRELGMIVWDVADLGGEVLDIIVYWRGRAIPIEIKSEGGKLTEDERISLEKLESCGIKTVVAYSIDDIVRAFDERD
jgi:hypothetical protein